VLHEWLAIDARRFDIGQSVCWTPMAFMRWSFRAASTKVAAGLM
jgi:hypothetical protein